MYIHLYIQQVAETSTHCLFLNEIYLIFLFLCMIYFLIELCSSLSCYFFLFILEEINYYYNYLSSQLSSISSVLLIVNSKATSMYKKQGCFKFYVFLILILEDS